MKIKNYYFVELTGSRAKNIKNKHLWHLNNHLTDDSIYKIYKRPSQYKINAWEIQRKMLDELKAYNICVYGLVQSYYVYANIKKAGKEFLLYLTKDHYYIIDIKRKENN